MAEPTEILTKDDRQKDFTSPEFHDLNGTPNEAPDAGRVAAEPSNGTASSPAKEPTWHAEAGRKGALRRRELIREGRLYEQEHGLSRGRLRIRQLIEQGRRYEEEHGLRPVRTKRAKVSNQQLLKTFFHSLLRIAKPRLRGEIARVMQALEELS